MTERVIIPFASFLLEAAESQGELDQINGTAPEWRNPFHAEE